MHKQSRVTSFTVIEAVHSPDYLSECVDSSPPVCADQQNFATVIQFMTNAAENDHEVQTEYVSIKFLLKQVYAAHSSKVKELESEIKKLKQELKNKQSAISECQKCKEMEAAYSACKDEYKNAVLEQTRRLKELELKFSAIEDKRKTISDQEAEIPANVHNATTSHLIPDTLSESFTLPETEITSTEPPEMVGRNKRYFSNASFALDSIENISDTSLQSPNTTIEKKNRNSFSAKSRNFLSSVRSSNASSTDNEVVLVPDTVDFSPSPPKNKLSVGKENKDVDCQIEKASASKKRTFSDEISLNGVKLSKPCRKSEDISAKVNSTSTEIVTTSAALTTKRKKLEKEPKAWSSNFKDFARSPQNSSPPSQLSKKDDSNLPSDDDFQSSDAVHEDSGTWKTSNKKSLLKKQMNLKGIKNTSCFKLTLEAHRENFKKPNYKQTKLSKSVFQPQNKIIEDTQPTSVAQNGDDACNNAAREIPAENINETSVAGLSELASLADEYRYTTGIPDSVLVNKTRLKSENEMLDGTETICPLEIENDDDEDCEEDVFLDDVPQFQDHKKDDNHTVENSFDIVPAAEEPNYKYKEDPVRNKDQRKKLNAFKCKDCEKYYDQLGLSEEEKKERLKQCSKHRAKYVPPATPDHFWELDFPDTEESKARGYQAETQKVQLKSRRRRPLE